MEYVIVTHNGRLIAVGPADGRPYETDKIAYARIWHSYDAAIQYIETFYEEAFPRGWRPCRVYVDTN